MRLSKAIIKVAIYGSSATGKTAITSELMRLLTGYDIAIRRCGEIIKDRAKSLGLESSSALALEEHKKIDDETKKAVSEPSSGIIVEGRYLNYVLSGIDQILFFKLNCSFEMRVSRLMKKLSHPHGQIVNIILSSDEEDRQLIHNLYGNSEPMLKHLMTLDTTNLTLSQSADRIFGTINKSL